MPLQFESAVSFVSQYCLHTVLVTLLLWGQHRGGGANATTASGTVPLAPRVWKVSNPDRLHESRLNAPHWH